MTYAITDFTRTDINYIAPGGTTYRSSMRTAFLGAWASSPVAVTGSPPILTKGVKMAHIWATASTGVSGASDLLKKFPVNASMTPIAPGTDSTVPVDGLTWTAMGYVGQKDRA
jgi:hypothetical protein